MNCTGSKEEKEWTIAVIEWLNGKVAMCGKSYLGTLSIAAATTGVEGLKIIIPEAAISNWYNYYRVNGVVGAPLEWQGDDADLLTKYCRGRECDDNIKLKKRYEETISQMLRGEARENGNYNSFWDVKTTHCKLLWDKLKKYNIPSKIILHQ